MTPRAIVLLILTTTLVAFPVCESVGQQEQPRGRSPDALTQIQQGVPAASVKSAAAITRNSAASQFAVPPGVYGIAIGGVAGGLLGHFMSRGACEMPRCPSVARDTRSGVLVGAGVGLLVELVIRYHLYPRRARGRRSVARDLQRNDPRTRHAAWPAAFGTLTNAEWGQGVPAHGPPPSAVRRLSGGGSGSPAASPLTVALSPGSSRSSRGSPSDCSETSRRPSDRARAPSPCRAPAPFG